jgi:hypothetical protein
MVGSAILAAPALASAAPTPAPAGTDAPAPAASPATATGGTIADKPYMGWSSWSLQATNYPGLNPDGPGSWINEANILIQADALAAKLKKFGYEYVNIDAGWQDGADEFGRPAPSAKRFPHGIASVADHVHGLGLKLGIYTAVGIGADAYRGGATPIFGAPGCVTKDIVYPDLRTTNGWDSGYKIDYTSPCAQKYADSIAALFAKWGVDFIKMDGVGPGSFRGGANYDNTTDVAAWSKSVAKTGRPMQYVISWGLSHRQADVWKANTNGWRIDTDVECYCDTLVTWDQSVKQRWNDVVQWTGDAGPGHWNNLDAINVGVGKMDGLTDAERQSYATFWAIQSAPLFSGDDLTQLDAYGLSLLTNREVIAIDQAGRPAKPVNQRSQQQVWHSRNANGSYTVALFNLDNEPKTVTADWSDVGLSGPAMVRDVWKGADTGVATGSVSVALPAHGSKLFTITPRGAAVAAVPTGVRASNSSPTSVDLAWDAAAAVSGAGRLGYRVYSAGREVARTNGTTATLSGLKPSLGYSFTVKAVRDNGTKSGASSALAITTPAAGRVLHEAEAPTNVIAGSASVATCSGCSGGSKVGNLGVASTVTFTAITVPVAGDYLMAIAYVDGSSSRQAVVTVNGSPSFEVNFDGSNDNDWDHAQSQNVLVHLAAGSNSIQLGHPTGYVSDIDSITL